MSESSPPPPRDDARAAAGRPSRRHRWSDQSAVLASIFLVALLAPLWIDPTVFGELIDSGGSTPQVTVPGVAEPTAGRPIPPDPGSAFGGEAHVLVEDSFQRTVATGWGISESGGSYMLGGPTADFAVGSVGATVRLPEPGIARTAFLPDASARDVNLLTGVLMDVLPVDGRLYVYALARRDATGLEYRPQLHIAPGGLVSAHAGVVLHGGEHSLGRPTVIPDLTVVPGGLIWMRAEIEGSDPTTIRVRAWADGTAEPEYWHFAVTDWTGPLQGDGAVGLAAYLGSRTTQGGAVVTFRRFTVITTDAQDNR